MDVGVSGRVRFRLRCLDADGLDWLRFLRVWWPLVSSYAGCGLVSWCCEGIGGGVDAVGCWSIGHEVFYGSLIWGDVGVLCGLWRKCSVMALISGTCLAFVKLRIFLEPL